MLVIIARSHSATWPPVDTTNYPSTETLTVCINLYRRHFHQWLPVVERGTSDFEGAAPLLLTAMAAIGSMYSRYNWRGLGIALGELVRRAVVYTVSTSQSLQRRADGQRESDRRFMFEENIVRAHLLQTYLAFYCGSQKAFHQAELSRGVLVTACKRMHLLRPGVSAVQALRATAGTPDPAELVRREKEDRRRALLGWCIYVRDNL